LVEIFGHYRIPMKVMAFFIAPSHPPSLCSIPASALLLRHQGHLVFVRQINLYEAYFSPRVPERPDLDEQLKEELDTVVKLRSYTGAASNESHLKPEVFNALQNLHRAVLATLSLMIEAYWSSRDHHLSIKNEPVLSDLNRLIPLALQSLQNKLVMGIPNNEISHELRKSSHALRELALKSIEGKEIETPFYAYVWLSLEMLRQLTALNDQLHTALFHPGHKHVFKKNPQQPDS